MAEFATRGVGNAGLATGIIGTALGVLNGGLGLAGRGMVAGACNDGCSENMPVNRYELNQQQKLANLESQVALRDANTYSDQKSIALYQYVDGRLRDIESQICAQAVHNQRTEDSFALARQDIAAVKAELGERIRMEAERRCCADNSIVNYANATFYPKMVADVTTGTTTTAQTLYNPIPKCGCECGN